MTGYLIRLTVDRSQLRFLLYRDSRATSSLSFFALGVHVRKLVLLAAAVSLSLGAAFSQADAAIIYQTGTSNPWSNTTNNAAMDSAFGAGNWTGGNGFDIGAFTGASFVFLDGSDLNSLQLQTFLSTNTAAISNYVSSGGRIFINDAPNEGGSFSFGFGVTMNYDNLSTFSNSAEVTAAGIAAGLTAGGISTSYSGNYFSHSTLSGPISALIVGDAGTIFGSLAFGSGFATFGGQTTANFHAPQADADRLLVNQLLYASGVSASPVPGPMVGAGVPGIVMAFAGLIAWRRRRNQAAVA